MKKQNLNFETGNAHIKKEQYQEAITFFSESIKTDKNHVESYFQRGMAYFRLEELEKAVLDFQVASTLAPEITDIQAQLAITFHHLGQKDKALKGLDLAIKLEPNNPYRYSCRAFILANYGKVDLAIKDYQKAIELDPEDAISLNNLGLLEEKAGKRAEAQKRFSKADELGKSKDKTNYDEKPDIDKLLEDLKKAKKAPSSTPLKDTLSTPSNTGAKLKFQKNTPVGYKDYLKVIGEIFSSKETRKEFLQFLKNLGNKKE